MSSTELFVRKLHPGMGQAVAERTILRKICPSCNQEMDVVKGGKANEVFCSKCGSTKSRWETWGEVADRVALGNSLLCPKKEDQESEYLLLKKHLSKATTLMSGRHLQHGDKNQPKNNMEKWTNCCVVNNCFSSFLLLMHGSGVGRCYDEDIILVNWDYAPTIRCVISEDHPNYDIKVHETVREALHKYGSGRDVMWHVVEDSREGWAKALEIWENAAFQKIHSTKMLILDFSNVRAKDTPIKGMQNRPASGPVPLMVAFQKTGSLKGSNLDPWLQNMFVDHYFSECVLVGGARRSARLAGKYWKDKGILDFITIKLPIEFAGKTIEEIIEMRSHKKYDPFLWSANDSILVDKEF